MAVWGRNRVEIRNRHIDEGAYDRDVGCLERVVLPKSSNSCLNNY